MSSSNRDVNKTGNYETKAETKGFENKAETEILPSRLTMRPGVETTQQMLMVLVICEAEYYITSGQH